MYVAEDVLFPSKSLVPSILEYIDVSRKVPRVPILEQIQDRLLPAIPE